MTQQRPARFPRLALHYASEGLRLAIVTGPFIWLPGIAISMEVAERYGWVSKDTAYEVIGRAFFVCLVLWLPASPLVRLMLVLVAAGLRDASRGARKLPLRRRR